MGVTISTFALSSKDSKTKISVKYGASQNETGTTNSVTTNSHGIKEGSVVTVSLNGSTPWSWYFYVDGENTATSHSSNGTIPLTVPRNGSTSTISGTAKCSFKKTITSYWEIVVPGGKDKDGNQLPDTYKQGSDSSTESYSRQDSASFTYYQAPAIFWWVEDKSRNFDPDDIIGVLFKASRVNEWTTEVGKYNNWYQQDDWAGSNSSKMSACKVESQDIITANWYNKCRVLPLGASIAEVTGGLDGTVIYADKINKLAEAIS